MPVLPPEPPEVPAVAVLEVPAVAVLEVPAVAGCFPRACLSLR